MSEPKEFPTSETGITFFQRDHKISTFAEDEDEKFESKKITDIGV